MESLLGSSAAAALTDNPPWMGDSSAALAICRVELQVTATIAANIVAHEYKRGMAIVGVLVRWIYLSVLYTNYVLLIHVWLHRSLCRNETERLVKFTDSTVTY
jgi:hypothetical protein